jgi:hypothetical protein
VKTKKVTNVLKDARSKTIEAAVQADNEERLRDKLEWQRRRQFLDQMIDDFKVGGMRSTPPKCVFVSFCATDDGQLLFGILKEKLEQKGFEVVTGFKTHEGDEGNVIKRVLGQLRRSSVYLGLLTKEMQVRGQDKKEYWAPSVWTTEEKGMAIALGKPFVLMVEQEILEDFWRKTAPEKAHIIFVRRDFTEMADLAVEEVKARYEELVIAAIS